MFKSRILPAVFHRKRLREIKAHNAQDRFRVNDHSIVIHINIKITCAGSGNQFLCLFHLGYFYLPLDHFNLPFQKAPGFSALQESPRQILESFSISIESYSMSFSQCQAISTIFFKIGLTGCFTGRPGDNSRWHARLPSIPHTAFSALLH